MDIKRVHVVDDEEIMLSSVSLMLGVMGYDCQQWLSPVTFLEQAEIDEGDAILIDLRMPGMDGFELFRTLRARGKAAPFILMTGHGTEQTVFDAVQRGFRAALLKPFSMADLSAAVKQAAA